MHKREKNYFKIFKLSFLFSISFLFSKAQVKFDTLKVLVPSPFTDLKPNLLKYPIFYTGNESLDKSLNNDLQMRYTVDNFAGETIDSAIYKFSVGSIVYMDFEITYNKNDLLSFSISAEGSGAHCSGWTEYYNYNTKTGAYLDITSVIDTTGNFRTMVYQLFETQYLKEIENLKLLAKDSTNEIDEATLNWALEYFESCKRNFNLETFSLDPAAIEIINDCYFPNAIKYLSPQFKLSFPYENVKPFLKVKLQ